MKQKLLQKSRAIVKDGIIKKEFKGYVMVRVGRKWLFEHTLVTEAFIGRTLEKGETIHHLDFNKKNNSISNLMVFPSQKEHASFHNKLRQFGWTNPLKLQVENRWKEFGK